MRGHVLMCNLRRRRVAMTAMVQDLEGGLGLPDEQAEGALENFV